MRAKNRAGCRTEAVGLPEAPEEVTLGKGIKEVCVLSSQGL